MSTTQRRYAPKSCTQGALEHFLFIREFRSIMNDWRGVFPQKRTWERVQDVLLGMMACPERTTITGSILYRCVEGQDWTRDYHVFNRSEWNPAGLFEPILIRSAQEVAENTPIVIAMDDTSLRKTGHKIPQARYGHDPLAPKFAEHPVMWCLRFLHASVLLNDNGRRPVPITIVFDLAPPAPKTMRQSPLWKKLQREASLTTRAAQAILRIREGLDAHQMAHRKVLMVVDASFTNSSVVSELPHDMDLIGRVRKDATLFEPLAIKDGKRIYGNQLPTPNEMRTDNQIPEAIARLRYGGRIREIRFKEIHPVMWKAGTHSRIMRLLILMPIPYLIPGKRKKGYNQPAYLLTTDLVSPAPALIQAYLDRWQIEVLHRDLKTNLGLGQAQVFSEAANEKVHTALAAAFAALSLAAHRAFHGVATSRFPRLAKWRKQPLRLSAQALLTLLRNELSKERFGESWQDTPKGWVLNHRETFYTP